MKKVILAVAVILFSAAVYAQDNKKQTDSKAGAKQEIYLLNLADEKAKDQKVYTEKRVYYIAYLENGNGGKLVSPFVGPFYVDEISGYGRDNACAIQAVSAILKPYYTPSNPSTLPQIMSGAFLFSEIEEAKIKGITKDENLPEGHVTTVMQTLRESSKDPEGIEFCLQKFLAEEREKTLIRSRNNPGEIMYMPKEKMLEKQQPKIDSVKNGLNSDLIPDGLEQIEETLKKEK